jgi:hypothetical protein
MSKSHHHPPSNPDVGVCSRGRRIKNNDVFKPDTRASNVFSVLGSVITSSHYFHTLIDRLPGKSISRPDLDILSVLRVTHWPSIFRVLQNAFRAYHAKPTSIIASGHLSQMSSGDLASLGRARLRCICLGCVVSARCLRLLPLRVRSQ